MSQGMQQLEAGQVPERYQRNMGTIGRAGQLRLLQAKVAVIGAGGLGGHVIELLARQGVGYLRVVDGDSFARHNLNRQLLATEANLGQNKAAAAAERVALINSEVRVEAVPCMLDEKNGAELLKGMDAAVDALDNMKSRRILAKAAQEMTIPLVHGAIGGYTGQVTTLLPGNTDWNRLFSLPSGKEKGIEEVLGNPAATPALTAAIQVQETVKLITGQGELLDRQLLYFDLQCNIFELFRLDGEKAK